MSNYQLLLGLAIGLIIAGVIYWLMPIIRKEKDVNYDEIKLMITDIVRESLKLANFKTEDELKKYCIELAQQRLHEQGIYFTDGEVEIIVNMIIKKFGDNGD